MKVHPKIPTYKSRIPCHTNTRTQEAFTKSLDRNEKRSKAKI